MRLPALLALLQSYHAYLLYLLYMTGLCSLYNDNLQRRACSFHSTFSRNDHFLLDSPYSALHVSKADDSGPQAP